MIEKASGETLIAIWDERPVWQAIREVDLEGPKTELELKPMVGPSSASVSISWTGKPTAWIWRGSFVSALGVRL